VHEDFNAEDVFAFGIDLQGQFTEMDFGHRQVIRRYLDNNSVSRLTHSADRVACGIQESS